MIAPMPTPILKTSEQDGNAIAIVQAVVKAMKRNGADQEYLDAYKKEAMSGDYSHLLATSMDYVYFE